jgi:acetyltransferase-like isoleucine patch superfamily enzyme
VRAGTRIGEFVHVGANAVILMGADIGHHSVVGAGAVVKENTTAPPYSLIVGVPARVIENGARRLTV